MIDENQGIEAPQEDAPDRLADFPRDAKPWLDMIKDGERVFHTYNEKCDNIDKLYAHLENMSKIKVDREFQIFWANLEVLKPSMYARAPVPVVVPRFKDMAELPRKASEVLERTLCTTFDLEDIDATMRGIRDDLATNARGSAWLRYEAEGEDETSFVEKVCFDHVDRKDFLHGPARSWREVPWVARRSWLTLKECKKRFGDIATRCTYAVPDDSRTEQSKEKKAQIWELWSKDDQAVLWVCNGVEELLDIQEPWLKLEGFFPCPRPAYGTLQRGSLIPVPDFLYYRDQIEEINELTARISALCESLRMKGFYAQGNESLSSAVEKAIKQQDNAAILIPVPSFNLVGNGSIKDAIVWLPVLEIAQVVRELIANRKQLIEDVYQITGLSDIMRGSTEASETLGAQKLKSQYGSVRIRDRQNELIRIARDITRMAAEIIAENFQLETLKTMSQVDLPTLAEVQQQQMMAQQQAMMQPPQMGQGGPMQPGAPQGQPAPQMPPQAPAAPPITFDAVMEIYRNERVRPFILDIETDSTIQPDEDAEKQRASEYITAVGGFMQQALPVGQALPQAVPLMGAMLKFTASKFRAGREMQGVIDQFVEEMTEKAKQPPPQRPDPEAMKAQAAMQQAQMNMQITQAKGQVDMQLAQANLALKNIDLQIKQIEAQAKMAEAQANAMQPGTPQVSYEADQAIADVHKTSAEIAKLVAETEKIRMETAHAPMQAMQGMNHAERQMELAENPEPAGAK
jgi:hypothetical protein